MLRDLDAVRRPVVRRDGEIEPYGYVARLTADGVQVLDHRERRPGCDSRFPGTLRPAGEVQDQTVDRGQIEPRDEQRHAFDDRAHDERGQGCPDHATHQEPASECGGRGVRGWRARDDRHGGDCVGPRWRPADLRMTF